MTGQKQIWSTILLVLALFVLVGVAHPVGVPATAAGVAYFGDANSDYVAKCANCHGRDGRGRTSRGRRAHARDMTDGNWQNDVTDERLFNSISNGRNKMPAFKKELSEARIDALVGYVRRMKK